MAMNETRTTGRWRTLIAIFVTLAYLAIYIFSVAWLMELIEAWPLWVRGILFVCLALYGSSPWDLCLSGPPKTRTVSCTTLETQRSPYRS